MGRNGVRVRTATDADLERLAQLSEILAEVGFPRRLGPRDPHNSRCIEERLSAILADPGRRLTVAVDEHEQVIGMAMFMRDAVGWLLDVPAIRVGCVVVDKAHRGRGAGRLLVAAAAAYAEDAGVEQVVVRAAPGEREANRFFARLGFAPVATHRLASVATLRRTLGVLEQSGETAHHVPRRRVLRVPGSLGRSKAARIGS